MNTNQQISIKKITRDLVSRPNETLGIAPKSKGDKLTALIKKLYAVILLVSQEQGDKDEYSIPLAQLVRRGNIDSKNTKLIREYLESMRRFSITWNTRKSDDEYEWRNTGMLKEVWLTQGKGKQTILSWELPNKIKERLVDPTSFFTRLSLQMMTSLRGGSAITLYEICSQYATNNHNGKGGGLTKRASIDWWRPRLNGSLDEDGCQEYKYFKRDLLLPSIREINDITDIEIQLIEHKSGRKVDEIQFLVFKKLQETLPLTNTNLIDNGLIDKIARFGISRKESEEIFLSNSPDFLQMTVDFVESRMKNRVAESLGSPAGYFIKALKGQWATAKKAPVVENNIFVQKNQQNQKISIEESVKWVENFEKYQLLDSETQEILLSKYKSLQDNPFHEQLRKYGLFRKVVKVHFATWLEGQI